MFSFHFGQEEQSMPSHLSACRECGGSGVVQPFGESVRCPFCAAPEERPPMPHYNAARLTAVDLDIQADESMHRYKDATADEQRLLLEEANAFRVAAALLRRKAEREGER